VSKEPKPVWRAPICCAAVTAIGITLGMMADGFVDWVAAVAIGVPVVLLARAAHWTRRTRRSKAAGETAV